MADGVMGSGWPAQRRCPHAKIEFCPLYIASHGPLSGGAPIYGCVWGEWSQGCAVDRQDIDYTREIARLCETLDGAALVMEQVHAEREDEAKAQRKRNIKAAGVW